MYPNGMILSARNKRIQDMPNHNQLTSLSSPAEPWINTANACKYLGISTPTLRRWIRDGKIKPKRTPTGEYRYRRSELDTLLG